MIGEIKLVCSVLEPGNDARDFNEPENPQLTCTIHSADYIQNHIK